jgi:hypothetical protein
LPESPLAWVWQDRLPVDAGAGGAVGAVELFAVVIVVAGCDDQVDSQVGDAVAGGNMVD